MTPLQAISDPAVASWLVAALIGAAVALAAFGVLGLTTGRRDPMRRRVREVAGIRRRSTGGNRLGVRLAETLEPLGVHLVPKRADERASLQLRLIRAGLRSEAAPAMVYAAKLVLMLGLPLITVVLLVKFTSMGPALVFTATAFAALVGMVAPERYIDHRIARRQAAMMRGFPDALDLLVSCTEAGLGLSAALVRVTEQMHLSSPLLARELEVLNAEIRSGLERTTALHNLVERTGLEELRGLVSLLAQSMRYGTSIADSLRIYAEEFRDRHTQEVEEQAAKVGTKLIFPLILCIFPSFFVVAIGPAVIALIRAFSASNMAGL